MSRIRIAHITPTGFVNESRILRENSELLLMRPDAEIHVIARNDRDNSLPGAERAAQWTVYRTGRRIFFLRGIAFLHWMLQILGRLRKLRPDILFVHAVVLLPVGLLARLMFGCRIVYDAHELETESNSLADKPLMKTVCKLIEAVGMPAVDVTLTVSPSIEGWYKRRYPKADVAFVPNFPVLSDLSARPEVRSLHELAALPPHKKLFLYLGNLCRGRGVPLIIDVAGRLQRDDIAFVFLGYGEFAGAIATARDQGLPVYHVPAVPSSEVIALAASAHAGLSMIEPLCLSYVYCYPNKLFEYIAAGIPVIVSDFPDMKAYVAQYGVGWVSPLAAADLLRCVEQAADTDRASMQANLARAREETTWQSAAAAFRRCLQPLMDRQVPAVQLRASRS